MFYYTTKYHFGLAAGSPETGVGGIIAASAMPLGQLRRRKLRGYPYLQRRLFDPQLYLASLDPALCGPTVADLATFPWFGPHDVPPFDSDKHKITKWKQEHGPALLKTWRRAAVTDPQEMLSCARSTILLQLDLGCEAIILPSPLTSSVGNYEAEARWLEAGLAASDELRVAVPIFATIAISDVVLKNQPPAANPVLQIATEQVAARRRVAGAYIVIEQASENTYCLTSADVMHSLLLLVDDLVRGAGRRAIVGYAGTFGAVVAAVGAEVWSSGYYLSQRQLKLSAFEEAIARALPRYYSPRLLGDIGIEQDLSSLVRARLIDRVVAATPAASPLHTALLAGQATSTVAPWRFTQNNLDAAKSHYNTCHAAIGTELLSRQPKHRLGIAHHWLRRSVALAAEIERAGINPSHYTDLSHQRAWLQAFEHWRKQAGV